jgi:hypothetical protein
MAPVLRQIYDQMMEPKWVISMGVCASRGGMFNNYAIVQGVDQIVPVDVYAPGCPPGPETLLHAILTLHHQIETGELLRRRAVHRWWCRIVVDRSTARPPRSRSAHRPARDRSLTMSDDRRPHRRDEAREPEHEARRVDPRRAGHPPRARPCCTRPATSTTTSCGARRRRLPHVPRRHGRRLPHPPRSFRLPEAIEPERFELVVQLHQPCRAKPHPSACPGARRRSRRPSLYDLHPGAEALEREVYDLFGIVFDRHPDSPAS